MIGTVLFLHVFHFFNRGKTHKERNNQISIYHLGDVHVFEHGVVPSGNQPPGGMTNIFWRRPVRSPKEVRRLLLEALSHFQLRQEVHIMRRYGPPHPFLLAMRSQWRPGLSGLFTYFLYVKHIHINTSNEIYIYIYIMCVCGEANPRNIHKKKNVLGFARPHRRHGAHELRPRSVPGSRWTSRAGSRSFTSLMPILGQARCKPWNSMASLLSIGLDRQTLTLGEIKVFFHRIKKQLCLVVADGSTATKAKVRLLWNADV